MNENCIISFANDNRQRNYIKSLARLSESLRYNFDGDFLSWIGENTLGAPPHHENPYAFKVYAFRKAKDMGYKRVLWLDSSAFAIKNVQPCFDEIEETGFLFQDAGFFASQYINDKALFYFGLTREEAREIRLIGNAGMLGLNFEMELPNSFLYQWEEAMLAGIFKGKWDNLNKTESESEECLGHRHDMISGIILHKLGVAHLMKPGTDWLQYGGVFAPVANDTIIFKAQGM